MACVSLIDKIPTMSQSHAVSVLAYEGMSAFETGIVTEVFGLVWPELAAPRYTLTICAEDRGPIGIVGGATLSTPYGLDDLAAADTVIVPSVSDVSSETSPAVVRSLRRAHERGARMVSICTGAFALAGAGLLDGRRATTHWRYADLLAEQFPKVEVDPNPLYVDDGDFLTSAGCAAGLDLCLHLVRMDYGGSVANAVARRLVVPPHREGGQAQFIEGPVTADPQDDRIARSMDWALANLDQPITVRGLAEVATMSSRTFLRHFTRSTGTSPIRWLRNQRVETSLRLLETTDAPIEEIAAAVGFETPITYRHHFRQMTHTSPTAYRKAFRESHAKNTTAPNFPRSC